MVQANHHGHGDVQALGAVDLGVVLDQVRLAQVQQSEGAADIGDVERLVVVIQDEDPIHTLVIPQPAGKWPGQKIKTHQRGALAGPEYPPPLGGRSLRSRRRGSTSGSIDSGSCLFQLEKEDAPSPPTAWGRVEDSE